MVTWHMLGKSTKYQKTACLLLKCLMHCDWSLADMAKCHSLLHSVPQPYRIPVATHFGLLQMLVRWPGMPSPSDCLASSFVKGSLSLDTLILAYFREEVSSVGCYWNHD
jgi:hypothetical protein